MDDAVFRLVVEREILNLQKHQGVRILMKKICRSIPVAVMAVLLLTPACGRKETTGQTAQAAPPATHRYELGETITFGQNGNAASYETGAWSHPEAWGTWSAGTEFGLQVETDQPTDSDLIFSSVVGAFVNEKQPELSAQVLVNGERIDEWRFVFGQGKEIYETHKATVPKAVFNKAKPCVILFRLSKATSPAELGLSGDPRKLGLGFIRAQLKRAQ
jgi:hypothetical protein